MGEEIREAGTEGRRGRRSAEKKRHPRVFLCPYMNFDVNIVRRFLNSCPFIQTNRSPRFARTVSLRKSYGSCPESISVPPPGRTRPSPRSANEAAPPAPVPPLIFPGRANNTDPAQVLPRPHRSCRTSFFLPGLRCPIFPKPGREDRKGTRAFA